MSNATAVPCKSNFKIMIISQLNLLQPAVDSDNALCLLTAIKCSCDSTDFLPPRESTKSMVSGFNDFGTLSFSSVTAKHNTPQEP
jgi:hypothetical protein